MVDGQCRTRQTEHHDGEEASLVHAGHAHDSLAGVDGGLATQEVRDVVDAGHVEPEHRVQGVVQTDRDQQTVEEGVDAGTGGAHADDGFTEVHQATIDNRPDGHQDEGDNDHDNGGHDRHQTTAGEEGQRLVQLDAAEAVVQLSRDDTAEDADELVADLGKGCRHLVGRDTLDLGNGARAQQCGDHQEADQTGQRGGTVFILGHAIGNTHGKQHGHAVDDGGTRLDQESCDRTSTAPAVRVNPIANPHQDRCGRQYRYRHHQGTADLLQITENVHGSSP